MNEYRHIFKNKRVKPGITMFVLSGFMMIYFLINFFDKPDMNICKVLEKSITHTVYPGIIVDSNVRGNDRAFLEALYTIPDCNMTDNSEKIAYEVDEKKVQTTEVNKTVEELAIMENNRVRYKSADTVSGTIYSYSDLSNLDFLKKNFYIVTSVTDLNNEVIDPAQALKRDLSIKKDSSKPQILIFHSHSQETFVDSVEGDYDTYIVGVGERLAKILREKYGYNVIHDTTKYDIQDGVLDRGKAYTYSNQAVDKILKENPSIEVVLDIHRDGVDESLHFVTDINGKKTAQIMFFNGISYTRVNGFIDYLNNPFLAGNLAMSLQMQLLTKAYYPDFTRKIYVQGYRYSQHHADRSMLVEVGAQTNTVEEAKNAMEPFADTLDKLLRGEKAYSIDNNN